MEKEVWLTRDDKSATAGDADDLHRSPLLHTHASTEPHGPAELGDEDRAEEPDACYLGCLYYFRYLPKGIGLPEAKDKLYVHDGERETTCDGEEHEAY